MASACSSSTKPTAEERVRALLSRTPVIDGHNDLLIHYLGPKQSLGTPDQYDIRQRTKGQVDLPRMREGRVGAAIFTVGINDTTDRAAAIEASTSLLRELARRSATDFEVVVAADGVARANTGGRIAALMGLEGGDQLGGSLDVLRAAHKAGVRAVTLTWDRSNDIGDASTGREQHHGLSAYGARVVAEMNQLGMLIDLSHASDSTAFDVLALTRAPIILSHSSARAIAPAPRNVSDTLLKAIARNDGIVMVTFVPYFTTRAYWDWFQRADTVWSELLTQHKGDRAVVGKAFDAWVGVNPPPRVTIGDVADHVEHIRDVAGIAHVGLGADFDGMDETRVTGLDDASTFPALFLELVRRGWTDADLEQLSSKNFLRVLRAVEANARK